MQTMEQFVDQLVAQKDLSNVAADVLVELKKDLLARLEDRVNMALVAAMPPEKIEEFEALVDQENAEAIQAFCKEHIPNMEEVIAGELLQFQQTYLRG